MREPFLAHSVPYQIIESFELPRDAFPNRQLSVGMTLKTPSSEISSLLMNLFEFFLLIQKQAFQNKGNGQPLQLPLDHVQHTNFFGS